MRRREIAAGSIVEDLQHGVGWNASLARHRHCLRRGDETIGADLLVSFMYVARLRACHRQRQSLCPTVGTSASIRQFSTDFADTITASVPASAPTTPPLIGASMTTTSVAVHSLLDLTDERPANRAGVDQCLESLSQRAIRRVQKARAEKSQASARDNDRVACIRQLSW